MDSDSEDMDSSEAESESQDEDSTDGGTASSTGGGVRLAAAPTSRLVSGFMGLMVAGLGACGSL